MNSEIKQRLMADTTFAESIAEVSSRVNVYELFRSIRMDEAREDGAMQSTFRNAFVNDVCSGLAFLAQDAQKLVAGYIGEAQLTGASDKLRALQEAMAELTASYDEAVNKSRLVCKATEGMPPSCKDGDSFAITKLFGISIE